MLLTAVNTDPLDVAVPSGLSVAEAFTERCKGWSTELPLVHRVPLLTITLQTTPSSQLYSQPAVFRAATTIDNELWFCFRQWS